MTHDPIDTMKFESAIISEGSWGSRILSDNTPSEMNLYFNKDNTGFIEWECPELDMSEEIGLVFELDRHGKRTLTDYDGVFSLPDQAMDLLERNGVNCEEMRKTLSS